MPNSTVRFIAEFRRRTVLPVVGVVVVAFALGVGLLFQIAREQDQKSMDQSTRMIATSIQHREAALAKTLKDYAAWGEAYKYLHVSFDKGWAYDQGNVGQTLFTNFGYEYVFLLSPKDETLYAVVDGNLSTATLADTLGGGADVLIARARRAAPDETTTQTDILMGGQEPVLVSAAALSTGGDSTVKAEPGPSSILVFGDKLTSADLASREAELFVSKLETRKNPGAFDAVVIH